MQKKADKQLDRIKTTFEEELKRKDKIIEELKKENILLIRTSLKQSEKTEFWRKYVEALEKKRTNESQKPQD